MILMLVPLASDPISNGWFVLVRDSLLALILVTIVVASFKGWITWPPEKQRMQETIDLLVTELQRNNATAERALPTTARLVEVVERQVSEPEVKISQAQLIAALQKVASKGQEVVGE